MDNILEKARSIVYDRSEEKERQYGDFSDSMKRMARIFNAMTGLDLEEKHMYYAMIALKLSRESHSHKEDNLLDAIAYMAALNDSEEKNQK